MKIQVLSFEQPAGCFLFGVMPAKDILAIAKANPREYDMDDLEPRAGVQRLVSRKRVTEIAKYAKTVDAAFPTPILLALKEDTYEVAGNELTIKDGVEVDVVDGQHRLQGLDMSGRVEDYRLPVVFVVDATEEQKALLFATINGTQTKVPASLIYDLFGVTEGRSPQKTSHEIARAMNSMPESPWYRRLKMLGVKTPGSNESLSQGTFVKELIRHVSADPVADMDQLRKGLEPAAYEHCVFNEYFRNKNDSAILKIMLNLFTAVRDTWPQEWKDPKGSVLTKTVCFSGIMASLPRLVEYGKTKHDLSHEFFLPVFESVKAQLDTEEKAVTSEHFPTSGAGANLFRDAILGALTGALSAES